MTSFVESSTPAVDPRLHKGFKADDILGDIRRALQTKCKGTNVRRTYWRFFNRNGRGGVDINEFVEAMHDLNLFYPREEVVKTFKKVDVDGNGTIDWSEFCAEFYRPDFTDEGRISTVKLGATEDLYVLPAPSRMLVPGNAARQSKLQPITIPLKSPPRRRSKSAHSLRRGRRRPGARGKCIPLYKPWADRLH